jgi:hypothetical protein
MAPKVTPKKVTLKKPVVRRSSQAASRKPIFGLGTLVTLVVFAGLILLTIFVNRKKETTIAETTPTEGIAFVFDGSEGNLASIEIKPAEGAAVKLVREDKTGWAFELPNKAEADQGMVEAAASQISSLQVVSPIDGKLSVFGLDKPAYVINLEFSDGKKRTLEVGDATPTNSGYYVRLDGKKLVIVDLTGISALTQLVDFPPYVSTPTPVITLTATELPPTETSTAAPTSETGITPTP